MAVHTITTFDAEGKEISVEEVEVPDPPQIDVAARIKDLQAQLDALQAHVKGA